MWLCLAKLKVPRVADAVEDLVDARLAVGVLGALDGGALRSSRAVEARRANRADGVVAVVVLWGPAAGEELVLAGGAELACGADDVGGGLALLGDVLGEGVFGRASAVQGAVVALGLCGVCGVGAAVDAGFAGYRVVAVGGAGGPDGALVA